MKCEEFWKVMPARADGSALANAEHLAQCPACSARLRAELALQKGLRAVSGQFRGIEAPPRVEARLRAAFRVQAGTAAASLRRDRPRAGWMPAFQWAAAAMVLLSMGVLLTGGRQPELAGRASQTDLVAESGTVAGEGGFILLPNATQIGPSEDVNMVRVEVPRSAMIALGYDVQPEQASETVQADVMLGTDGLARAVRFLD